jgi:hypothetical protein
LHEVAALPLQVEWEEVRWHISRILCCNHHHCFLQHRHIQILNVICDFCSDLCVFVGKRAISSSSSSSSSRAISEIEVILGTCLSLTDGGLHASVDVVSRETDFPSSSWRR